MFYLSFQVPASTFVFVVLGKGITVTEPPVLAGVALSLAREFGKALRTKLFSTILKLIFTIKKAAKIVLFGHALEQVAASGAICLGHEVVVYGRIDVHIFNLLRMHMIDVSMQLHFMPNTFVCLQIVFLHMGVHRI